MSDKRPSEGEDQQTKRSKPELYSEFAKFYEPKNHVDKKGIEADGEKGRIICGKTISAGIRAKIKKDIEERLADEKYVQRAPGLTVILVGENPASKVYIRQKENACKEVGIISTLLNLPSDTTLETLMSHIDRLNEDETCDGILVQLPLPDSLEGAVRDVIQRIKPDKDVDGFHPTNIGNLVSRTPTLRPCTPWGVMQLIWSTGVNPYGLECLVVGASNHVGRPMMLELLLNGASCQMAHRFTRDLEAHVRRAECVIVAAGKPGLVKGEWIKPGAIVIDIGINRVGKKLVGDVDFEVAKQNAGYITPVPGGVGPMTVAMLLSNTVSAYDTHRKEK
eukprot:TRINITY_DN877_c0_g1_i1.p1 TRINITY_DN877_c0_g1~~TRINITY_DN877_c0_g1_i1.p1  ORF type:complete len:335 (+),score=54.24 TRINITY_DN877_c0_g1_i1:174-1178(+)